MTDLLETWRDELEIRWLIEKWVLWRDGAHWDRFQTVWNSDGRMIATWFDGPATEFIARSRAGWLAGVNVNHFLGGTVVDIAGTRALAETKMTISQRLTVHDRLVDVVCTGRFYDFLDARAGSWRFAQRQCIYETDRIIPLTPGPAIPLDAERLARYPEGYRHLGYVQELAGMQVNPNLPGRNGPELDRLYERGRTWLTDGNVDILHGGEDRG
jgi:hypothetical protein